METIYRVVMTPCLFLYHLSSMCLPIVDEDYDSQISYRAHITITTLSLKQATLFS